MFDEKTIKEITEVANVNGINANALLAVVEVESAGIPFWKVGNNNKPAIRFEGHYFYARLQGTKLIEAVTQGLASKKVGGVRNPNSYAARYALLERAKKIDTKAALESTSWGVGQVMGANWKDLGYNTVEEFTDTANTLKGQVEMMIQFIFFNNLDDELESMKWAEFAKGYNGKNYHVNKYDTKMKTAFDAYSKGNNIEADKELVRIMQLQLNAVGKYNLILDGVDGNLTDVALRDFQLKHGLKPDGIFGPLTKAELEKQYLAIGKKTEQNVGATVAATGVAGEVVMKAAEQILPLADYAPILNWVFVALILIGVLFSFKSIFWK